MNKQIITRFAPSPTGFLHIGGVRTALFSFLFARQNKGIYMLRIEDTDKARNKQEWIDGIISDFEWLGLKHDVYAGKQSENLETHKKYLHKLIEGGHAYISKETPTEEGQNTEVVRFKNPNKKVHITDMIRGEVVIDTTDLGDFIIARNINDPLYHLAVVVDDIESKVTHIIRAEEHLSNTPRQILIIEALGAQRPLYAHLPLVLASDKSKLSKRKHGETVSLTYYRNLGYLPTAILNFVALMGWNPGTDQEIFSLDELITQFRLDKVQKGGAVFNVEKLNWINKKYIEKMSDADFKESIKPFLPSDLSPELLAKFLPLIKEKISYFGQIKDLFIPGGELSFIYPLQSYPKEKLMWKQEKDIAISKGHLKTIIDSLSSLSSADFTTEKVKEIVWPLAEKNGKGNVLWPMRYALSGQDRSPDPLVISGILGKEETLKRLTFAYELI